MNLCTKPSCTRPGAVVLAYDYAERRAILEDAPQGQLSPHVYVLCVGCAERLSPPRGWDLEDLRSEPPLFLDPASGPVAPAETSVDEALEEASVATSRRQLFFGYST